MTELTDLGSSVSADSETDTSLREILTHARSELMHYRPDIISEELRKEVTAFLMDAHDLPSSSTEDYISNRLATLRAQNEMFRTPDHDDGTEAFPEDCEGCPHYGVRCPVIKDSAKRRRRDEIMSSADDEDELRRRLRDLALDNECHVLLEALSEVSGQLVPMTKRAQLLLMAVEDELILDDPQQVARIVERYNRVVEGRHMEFPDPRDLEDADTVSDLRSLDDLDRDPDSDLDSEADPEADANTDGEADLASIPGGDD